MVSVWSSVQVEFAWWKESWGRGRRGCGLKSLLLEVIVELLTKSIIIIVGVVLPIVVVLIGVVLTIVVLAIVLPVVVLTIVVGLTFVSEIVRELTVDLLLLVLNGVVLWVRVVLWDGQGLLLLLSTGLVLGLGLLLSWDRDGLRGLRQMVTGHLEPVLTF